MQINDSEGQIVFHWFKKYIAETNKKDVFDVGIDYYSVNSTKTLKPKSNKKYILKKMSLTQTLTNKYY